MPFATDSIATARLPAWQRLGLKLKSAQESSPERISTPPASNEVVTSKRKRLDSTGDVNLKKFKTSRHPQAPALSSSPLTTPTLARKKSVTFTPDTKIEDGDSIKQLFNAWAAEQNANDLSGQIFQIPKPAQIEENFDLTLDEKTRRISRVKKPTQESGEIEKRAKINAKQTIGTLKIPADAKEEARKVKKPKKQNIDKNHQLENSKITKSTETATFRPFLAYLQQYSESREDWKFNKNHQTHLLKHFFELDIIPPEYGRFVYEYVKGLQGGVRTRLRDTALKLKVKDQEETTAMFSKDVPGDLEKCQRQQAATRQAEYNTALQEYVATMTVAHASSNLGYDEGIELNLSDHTLGERLTKRKRTEIILAALATSEGAAGVGGPAEGKVVSSDDESQKRVRMNDGSSQKVARKRKQRTTVAEDDTSSSEEDSDSEDTSDAAESSDNDDTSSSSSSSSGSDDSNDSEDDSEDDNDEDDSE